jgi:uncharacterized lipoprotein
MKTPHPLRAVAALLAALLLALLAACSSSNTPDEVVKTFVSAAAKGDADTMLAHVSTKGLSDPDVTMAKAKMNMMAADAQKRAQKRGGFKSVEITESKIDSDGKTATVQFKEKFGDGTEGSVEHFALLLEDGHWKIKLK